MRECIKNLIVFKEGLHKKRRDTSGVLQRNQNLLFGDNDE